MPTLVISLKNRFLTICSPKKISKMKIRPAIQKGFVESNWPFWLIWPCTLSRIDLVRFEHFFYFRPHIVNVQLFIDKAAVCLFIAKIHSYFAVYSVWIRRWFMQENELCLKVAEFLDTIAFLYNKKILLAWQISPLHSFKLSIPIQSAVCFYASFANVNKQLSSSSGWVQLEANLYWIYTMVVLLL